MFHTSIEDVKLIHEELESFGVAVDRISNDAEFWNNTIRKELESSISVDLYMDMFVNWYREKRLSIDLPTFDKQQIYLISSGEFHKIGKSMSPENRVQQISTSIPFDVSLCTTFQVDNASKCELFLHDLFRDSNKKGEWFYLFDCEITAIKNIAYIIEGRFYPRYLFTHLMRFISDVDDFLRVNGINKTVVPLLEVI